MTIFLANSYLGTELFYASQMVLFFFVCFFVFYLFQLQKWVCVLLQVASNKVLKIYILFIQWLELAVFFMLEYL